MRTFAAIVIVLVAGWSAPAAAQISAPARIAYDQCVAHLDAWALVCGTYVLVDGGVSFGAGGFEPKWATANHDPDGDSSGTRLTVRKPQ